MLEVEHENPVEMVSTSVSIIKFINDKSYCPQMRNVLDLGQDIGIGIKLSLSSNNSEVCHIIF